MPEPAFDTLEAARRLKSAGIESEHAEAIVEVMGQSVNQLVTREHFDASIAKLGTELHARIDGQDTRIDANHTELSARFDSGHAELSARIDTSHAELSARIDASHAELSARIDTSHAELSARIDGVESKVQALEATVRTEIMRAVLIVVGILIPAIGLMIAFAEFYSARGGWA